MTPVKPDFVYLKTSLSPDSSPLDCAPCDCSGTCGTTCGHSIDIFDSDPIYICNTLCSCPSSCANKISTVGLKSTVKYDEKKGWCLLSLSHLSSFTYIGDYTGLIISTEEARARHLTAGVNYVLSIREQSEGGTLLTHIDATTHGSELRFMNHSCSPNVIVVPVRDNTVHPRATCWTNSTVKPGDELCISYGSPKQLGTVVCYCGSPQCSGYLPFQTSENTFLD